MDRQKKQNSLLAGIYPLIRRQSSAGLTIVETLIATTIVVITLLVSASYFSQQGNQIKVMSESGTCKMALETQMAFLRQQSVSPFGVPWTDAAANGVERTNPALNAPGSSSVTGVNPADLLDSSVSPPRLSSALYQRSALAELTRIYNSGVSAGGSFTIPNLPNVATGLQNFTSTAQIRTYNVDTGADQAPANLPLVLKPRPVRPANNIAFANPPIVQFPANVVDDLGLRVTLNGTYTENGNTKGCTLSEDFRYPVDYEVKEPSVIMNVYSDTPTNPNIGPGNMCPTSKTASSRNLCSQTSPNLPAQLTLKIGFQQQNRSEPGTMYLCRDTSVQLNPNYCAGAPGSAMNGNPSQVNRPWVPCDRVTACGVAAATKSFSAATNEYTLNYSGNMWGCEIKIDVATVDIAGNFKRLSDIPLMNSPTVKSDTTLKYLQGANCYKCYKKKRNFGNFIAVAFLFGLAGLTIFCAIGNCAPKGTKFVRNQCRNNPAPSNGFCTLSPQKFPAWWDQPTMRTPACTGPIVPGGGSCPSITVPYPITPAQVATLPAAENGEAVEVRLDMPQTGLACEAQAICQNGQWIPFPTFDNSPTQIASCSKMVTRKRIDITNVAVGAVPTLNDVKADCIFPVPFSPVNIPVDTNFNFPRYVQPGFKVCNNAESKLSTPVICKPNPVGLGYANPTFPKYPPPSNANATDPTKYLIFEHIIPTPNLPACPEQ